MELDFSKAVIFQMEVVSCYTQYIVKLSVAGEKEYYYVLSDEGTTGLISVNVVDAMLCDKYREKNTQPDPGYATGWKYDGQKKNCTFHILAKGPSGEQQTAEVVVKSIAIYNDQEAVTGVSISGACSFPPKSRRSRSRIRAFFGRARTKPSQPSATAAW